MNEAATWEATNSRHLAAALRRLKARLERHIGGKDAGAPAAPARERKDDAAAGAIPALELLARALGLSPFERDLLLL